MNTTIAMQVCNKAVTAEVGCEYSMPDYQPEVRRLLRVQATVLPPAAYVGAGRAEFAGTVRYDVLYSGNDGGLYSVSMAENYELSAPLDKDADVDYSDDISAFCHIEPEVLTGRVTAPRKLSVRCRLRGNIKAFGQHRLVERMHGRVPEGIERLVGETTCGRLTRSASETVTLSDELPPMDGNVRVISCDAVGTVSEMQPTAEGVGCRGEMAVKLMTCADGEDTTPTVTIRRLPFNVMVPADDFTPATDCFGRVCCTELSTEVAEDGRILCDMTAVVTVEGQENIPVTYTADLYSTECDSSAVYADHTFPTASRCLSGNFTQSVYEPLASFDLEPDCEVLDVCATASATNIAFDKNKWLFTGETHLLLLTRVGDEYASHELTLPFRYETEGEGGDLALAEADIQMTSARARVEGGRLGLECEMSITARLCTAATLTALAEATFGDPVEKPTDLLIAYPAHNETLWSLAKRYHAPLSTFSSMSPDTVLAKGEGIVVFE